MANNVSASIPALTCAMGSSITASIPALTSVMVGGAYINASIAALTCDIDATYTAFVPASPGPLATKITLKIDHTKIDEDLTDFPVMINLNPLGDVWTEITTDGDRKKLKVKHIDGTEYYVEIEYFDTTTKKGLLWVKIPSISSTVDTEFILEVGILYDNTTYVSDSGGIAAQSVWDSNFVLVYHMNQAPGGSDSIIDSTVNGNDGTPYNMSSGDLVDSEFGKAIRFSGIDEFMTLGANASLVFGVGDFTLEAKYKVTGPDDYILASYGNMYNEPGYALHTDYDGTVLFYIDDNSNPLNYSAAVIKGEDQEHVCAVSVERDNSVSIFIDSVMIVDESVSACSGNILADNVKIGFYTYNVTSSGWFIGEISELRMSNVNRSDAWLKATSFSSLDTLLTISSIEASDNIEGFEGDLTGSLGALTMTALGDPYRNFDCTIPLLTCEMVGVANKLAINIKLPTIVSDSHAAGHLSESIPGLTMDAEGFNGILAQLAGKFSDFSMIAMSGALLSGGMAAPVVEMVGTNQSVTALSSSFSALRATISSNHENPTTIITNLPTLQAALTGNNGAICTINANFPMLTFSVTGQVGVVANLTTYLPGITCSIAASLNSSNTIDFILHELTMLGIIDNLDSDTILRHIRGQIR